MMNRRTLLVAFGLGALAAPLASFAQQSPAKVPRIGFLGVGSASNTASRLEGLRAGLRDLGYVEGRNLVIEYRWAEGKYERFPELAAELVRLKVDVIVTFGQAGALAAKQATTTIPIVIAAVGDIVATGIVTSLARPGGNITGSTFFSPELSAKRIELLKEAMPRITRVAILVNPDNPTRMAEFQAIERTAKSLKVGLRRFDVRGPNEFEGAFSAMAKQRVGAVAILEDAMLNVYHKANADLAVRNRIPSAGNREFAEAGGLIGYGVNFFEMFRRAAYFVGRILKGAKPADLPVEQAARFELLVNRKTAKALGLRVSRELLLRTDRVIE